MLERDRAMRLQAAVDARVGGAFGRRGVQEKMFQLP